MEEAFTALHDVGIGGGKVPAVPGVVNVPGTAGKIQQAHDFMLRVFGDNPAEVADVILLGAEQIVKRLIVPAANLAGSVSGAGEAVASQLPAGGGINPVSDFFRAGGGAFNVEFVGNALFFHHVFENKFRHRRAADVAVTNE